MGGSALKNTYTRRYEADEFRLLSEEVTKLINKNTHAVLVEMDNGKYHIITRYDIISSLS